MARHSGCTPSTHILLQILMFDQGVFEIARALSSLHFAFDELQTMSEKNTVDTLREDR